MLRKSFGSVRGMPGNGHSYRAIDRRAFIGNVFVGMLAAPLIALAQQPERMRRIVPRRSAVFSNSGRGIC